MIAANEGQGDDQQYECEGCGRSVISRFGGPPDEECQSCLAEYKLLHSAGKITFSQDGWTIEVVKIGEAVCTKSPLSS